VSIKRAFGAAAVLLLKLYYLGGGFLIGLLGLFSSRDRNRHPREFAMVSYYLPPMWSGGAVVLGRLLQDVNGNDYCLLSRFEHGAGDSESFIERLPAPYHHVAGNLFMPGSSSRNAVILRAGFQIFVRSWKLARILKRERAACVVATTGDLVEVPAAFIAARLAGARYFVYLFDDFISQWWADERALWLARRLERLIFPRADGLIAPNEFMAREIHERYGRTTHIVRNPCSDDSLFEPLTEADTGAIERFEIIFTGAAYHVNLDAIELLIDAIERVDDCDIRLVLYTAQADALRGSSIDRERVVLRGHIPPPDVARTQASAGALLIPFTFDERAATLVRTSATAKLADYLASGRPVLALGPGDSYVAEYLRAHDCGYVADRNDPDMVAAVLRELVHDVRHRVEVSNNAIARARIDFDRVSAQDAFLDAIGATAVPRLKITPHRRAPDRPLRLLQITGYDSFGEYANGYLIHTAARQLGHDSHMAVHKKLRDESRIHELGTPRLRKWQESVDKLESRLSTHAMLSVESLNLYAQYYYRNADVINLHIPHVTSFMSMMNVPIMSRGHKIVWSIHDMWMISGHCTYSLGCERWKTGCGACPDLTIPFEIAEDKTARNWRMKKKIVEHSDFTIVVGAQFALDDIKASPILGEMPCRLIPYGVDVSTFKPIDQNRARAEFGIPPRAKVIAFRSAPFHRNYKGTDHIEKALQNLQCDEPVVLLTFETVGGLESLRSRYEFVELGWEADRARIALAMNAADIFLMPSIAEYFGIMAAEAMACGTPMIVFDGTALPEVVAAPSAGIAVPMGDHEALRQAIETLLSNADLRGRMGQAGVDRVRQNYTLDHYLKGHFDLYEELALN
jgi:glycosyltransferase involved in cell wall biosynthesis